MADLRRILVIGGGFAGIAATRALARRLPEGVELVLVSEDSATCFTPMLPEVAGAAIFPEQVAAPLRQILGIGRRSRAPRFIMGRVEGIDRAARTATIATLAGPLELGWEQLVLAVGARARLDLLPGMAEHALPLKTIGDALAIRNRVLEQLAMAELATAPGAAARAVTFLVVGGGFSGVELAGAIACYARSAHRAYPHAPERPRILLVHDGARLLPELPEPLGRAALRTLERLGVAVRLETGVQTIEAQGAILADGSRIEAGTVIATIGTMPSPLVPGLGLALDRGRLVVGAHLATPGDPRIWAIGDCAAVPNAHDGALAPPTAQFAVRQGRALAANILAAIDGRPLHPFRYAPRGSLAAIGHMDGVAEIFGLRLTGLPAWLLWRAWYLALMPSFGRRLRIWLEWTLSMVLPLDITHLRFHRSADRALSASPQTRRIAA